MLRDQSSLHAPGQEPAAVVLPVSTLHETVKTALTLDKSVKPVLTLVKTVNTVVTLIKRGLAHKGVAVSALLYYSQAYGWVIHKFTSLRYEPASESLHVSAK